MQARLKRNRLSDGSDAYDLEITDDAGDSITMPCNGYSAAVILDEFVVTLKDLIEACTVTMLDIED